MKRQLPLLALALFSCLSVKAQCEAPDCSGVTYAVPITDVNDFNNNHRGSNCLEGSGTVPTSANFNDWTFYSFNSEDGIMYVNQTINYSTTGTKVFSYGHVECNQVNFVGGSYWYANGDSLVISSITANNYSDDHPNVIYLNSDDGTRLFIGGTEYFDGDCKSTADNPTNKVCVLTCGSGALPVKIVDFYLFGDGLYWQVADNISDITVQRSDDSRTWTDYVTTENVYSTMQVPTGYYRLKVDGYYSEVLYYQGREKAASTIKRDLYTGQVIETPIPYRPYVEDRKVKVTIE